MTTVFRYLLFCQTLNLFAYVSVVVTAILHAAHIYVYAEPLNPFIGPLLFGLGVWAIIRTILLPAQIYELHVVNLNAAAEEKSRERAERRRQQQEQIRSCTDLSVR